MPPDARDGLPYRDCVGVALFNRDGQVFVGRRRGAGDPEQSANLDAPWQMPQGGIDPGETPYVAALRELHEETNVSSVTLIAEAPEWILYDLPEALAGSAWKGKYRGQRQRWFAFALTGSDDEIDVLAPGNGAHRPEFDAWRWERLELLPDLIVSFKREAYREVVRAFADIPRRFTHA